ncbi:MAG TPA: ester cyclase [Pyrinomonadaceae bacterium]|nr:ester cyclase [Pyrinomonadaceae bacterium]
MSAEENAAIVRRWFEEVWNKGREEAIDELLAEDGVAHGLPDESGGSLRGPSGFKPFFRKFRESFPNIEVTVEDTVAEGDRVAARCAVRGRHEGDALGVAATRRDVHFTGICIVRVKDGRIVEAWNNFDFMSLFQQLGAI